MILRPWPKPKKKKPNPNSGINRSFYIYKYGAKTRNLSFALSLEQFKNLVLQPCHYCQSFKKMSGIDRVDNFFGYEVNNCIPCCFLCNRAKSNMHYDDFMDWILDLKGIPKE